jgi:hypothetical protein
MGSKDEGPKQFLAGVTHARAKIAINTRWGNTEAVEAAKRELRGLRRDEAIAKAHAILAAAMTNDENG